MHNTHKQRFFVCAVQRAPDCERIRKQQARKWDDMLVVMLLI